ncbi:hypothetical protein CHS0354_033935 [Potamilus streckersoni]|uniref:Uncharacterized protein n=1 Tax=Potamilus streckersoni TaxID=2493646 RepID=A0AAE0RWZ4_9BIVA|nr:hypothetical protein CHS0354_033935 [Potamilus streckersoni]
MDQNPPPPTNAQQRSSYTNVTIKLKPGYLTNAPFSRLNFGHSTRISIGSKAKGNNNFSSLSALHTIQKGGSNFRPNMLEKILYTLRGIYNENIIAEFLLVPSHIRKRQG